MRLPLFLAVLTVWFSVPVFGQTCVILDADQSPIPYVNGYAPAVSTGLVSEFDGSLELTNTLKQAPGTTPITFSCVGFKDTTILLADLRSGAACPLVLAKADYTLAAAEVSSTRLNYSEVRRLGLHKPVSNVHASFSLDSLEERGTEMGNLIRVKGAWQLDRIGANFSRSSDTCRFEVNVYSFENKEPGRQLNTERYFLDLLPNDEDQELVIDLSEAPLAGTGDFIVVLETLSAPTDHPATFHAKVAMRPKKRITYYRQSDGTWRKAPIGVVVSVFADVRSIK